MNLYLKTLAGAFLAGFALSATAAPPLKVICAARATTAPVIDGNLDEECWKRAEARTDFVAPSSGELMPRLTVMRLLFDDRNLYLGLECQFADAQALAAGIAAIRTKAGTINDGITPISEYANEYGVELFIDPGASERNYYQILFNAAGQFTGNYKALWAPFRGGQTVRSTVTGNRWRAEMAYPCPGIKAGDEWGLNLCRNDETYYSMWKMVSGSYHEPKLFGRIVMGDYADWWTAVWSAGVKGRLTEMEKKLPKLVRRQPDLTNLHQSVITRMQALNDLAKDRDPTTREEFEALYTAWAEFRKDFSRFVSAYDMAALMEK